VSALAGCGGGSHAPAPGGVAGTGQPVVEHAVLRPKPKPKPKPKPVPLTPALIALRSSLTGDLNSAGPQTGAAVYSLDDHVPLFSLRGNVKRPPASVEKIYTTVAVLQKMGPNVTLETTIRGEGHLARGGVWDGNLYLVGGGDPTFGDSTFNRTWEQGQGPTPNQLVAQLQARGIKRVSGQVIGDAALFDGLRGGPNTAYRPDIPDIGGQLGALTYDHGSTSGSLNPGAFAANELVLTMKASGIQATAATRTLPAPGGTKLLASVSSPPMSTLLRLMDVPSDDFFAELLAKQLGARFGGAGTTAAGASVVKQVIASYDVHPQIVDGSGLSRHDLTSPDEVVTLLAKIWRRAPVGDVLWDSLPVVGVSGTTTTIGVKTPAQGNCYAKTGTLNNVTNLAGYCHARGHKDLAFALFIDGPSNATALQLMNKLVADVAKY
jgi:serine-type D-Ala-D-Ala carboxypeptidase/endopeptidase (penicillin-binding protein 4)